MPDPVEISRWTRWYLTPRGQSAYLLAVMATLVLVAGSAHLIFASNYQRSVKIALEAQKHLCAMRIDPESGRLAVSVGGSGSSKDDDFASLGLAKNPAIRALIAHLRARADLINDTIARHCDAVLRATSAGVGDRHETPASAVGLKTDGVIMWRGPLPAGGSLRGWLALRDAIAAGGQPIPAAADPRYDPVPIESANGEVSASLKHIAEVTKLALGAASRSGVYQSLSPDDQRAVRGFFDALLGECCSDIAPAPDGNTARSGDASVAMLACLNHSAQLEVFGNLSSEFSGLWLYGVWRWFEMVIWTMLGVLAFGMYQHGNALVGRSTFEPAEFQKTLLKLGYAPVMALCLSWLFLYSTSLESPVDFVASSPALLGYAFIMGLFPTRVYTVIHGAMTALLRIPDPPESARDKGSDIVSVPLAVPPAPELASTLANIRKLALAPLRRSDS